MLIYLFFTYSIIVHCMYDFKYVGDMFKQTTWKILIT